MNKISKKKWFVGIDISKDKIDAALVNEKEPRRFINGTFSNDFTGFEAMTVWLSKLKVKITDGMFCMEHTGTYGLLLFAWLGQQNADFCVEPVEKVFGETYLSDAEKSGIVECATIEF